MSDSMKELLERWRNGDEAAASKIHRRYEIHDVLGVGGMGTVYRALDTRLERKVALKVPQFDPSTDSEIRERFRRESKAAAAIRHPNICPVYDSGEVNGVFYLTMPLIEGRSNAGSSR